LIDDLKKNLFALPVIDCTGAYFPFVGIWKQQLVKASQKEGLTIYGDWDGRMKKAYQAVDQEANFYLIDKSGTIRYFIAGKVDDKAIAGIIGQIDQLLK
jgi:predicted transcriptional regulator